MDGNTCPAAIAADLASAKGILVTASAGNEGSSSWNYLITPSDGDSVLAVGAVDPSSVYATFSSNGPASDGRVKPDVAAQGQQTTLYSPWSGGSPVQGNGTSFSGPIIAGAAACLWQSSPQHTNQQIIQAIRQSASQYSSPDTNIGYGIPNFSFASNLLGLDDITIPSNAPIHIFPNPSEKGSEVHILYLSKSTQLLELNIYDLSGRIIYNDNIQTSGYGYTEIRLNPGLQSGIYQVEISGREGNFSGRILRR
jgi:serine protease AprX